jgi:hypothetical protein
MDKMKEYNKTISRYESLEFYKEIENSKRKKSVEEIYRTKDKDGLDIGLYKGKDFNLSMKENKDGSVQARVWMNGVTSEEKSKLSKLLKIKIN